MEKFNIVAKDKSVRPNAVVKQTELQQPRPYQLLDYALQRTEKSRTHIADHLVADNCSKGYFPLSLGKEWFEVNGSSKEAIRPGKNSSM